MKTNALAEQAAKVQNPKSAATTPVAKPHVQPPSVVAGNLLAKYKAEIAQALPSVITPERFSRIATNAIASNPKMMQAVNDSPRTLVGALMTCAQLGIEPNTPLGQGYLLPYFNFDKSLGRKVMQVNFQLGIYGVIDLAYRSGEVTMIQAQTIYEKDDWEYELGLDPKLTHKPYRGADRGEPVAYYGLFKTKNGATGFAFMYKEEVLEHAKRFSKSYDANSGRFFGPWETDFDAMAKKTVLLQALKYAPKKSDFARALSLDNTTKSTLAKDMAEVRNEDVIDVESSLVAPTKEAAAETAPATSKTSDKTVTDAPSTPAPEGMKDIDDIL